MRELIYLAAPFTHSEKSVVEYRMSVVNKIAANLMASGEYVFSPLTHCYPLAQIAQLPGDWEFWEGYDRLMMTKCTKVMVICMPGWKESIGVQAEIRLANEFGIPVEYIHPDAS